MTIHDQLQALSPFHNHTNQHIAEYAQTISNYALALCEGKLSSSEYHSLIGDVETLKRMATTADEEAQVAEIHSISRTLISLI